MERGYSRWALEVGSSLGLGLVSRSSPPPQPRCHSLRACGQVWCHIGEGTWPRGRGEVRKKKKKLMWELDLGTQKEGLGRASNATMHLHATHASASPTLAMGPGFMLKEHGTTAHVGVPGAMQAKEGWWGRGAFEGQGPQRRLDRRLEEVAKAVGGGYCRLQTPLSLALAARGTVAGHRLGALEGRRGGGGGALGWSWEKGTTNRDHYFQQQMTTASFGDNFGGKFFVRGKLRHNSNFGAGPSDTGNFDTTNPRFLVDNRLRETLASEIDSLSIGPPS